MAEAQADQEPEAGLASSASAGEPEAARSPGEDVGTAGSPPASGVDSSGDLVADTLIYLARSLVVHVDDVRVEQSVGERGPIYRLRVNPEDMGRVIGKSGRLARSIRQVARAAAARAGTTAFIEIAG